MNVRRRRVPVCVLLTPTASTRRARTSVSVQLASRQSQINQPTATLSPAKVILLLYFTASFTLVRYLYILAINHDVILQLGSNAKTIHLNCYR